MTWTIDTPPATEWDTTSNSSNSWTNESEISGSWTNNTTPLLVQEETLYNDNNSYDVSGAGKGYYYNDRIEGGAYTNSNNPSTIWT